MEKLIRPSTPWEKLAIVAKRVAKQTVEKINEGRIAHPELRLPLIEYFAPDVKDFEADFELYMKKEIYEAQLQILEKYGTLHQALQILRELDEINFKIAIKENPDRR
jgi:hypothetical protein